MQKCLIILSLLILLFTFPSCKNSNNKQDILQYVNPFIGTGGHGHTYPGATSPFGMVQLSPDTRLEGWDGCSGYHYSDSVIYGFSHTHLSGTGVSDYGDILLMPIHGNAVFDNSQYSSTFSHKNETAEAGYYKVLLDKSNILAELSTTTRTGMHRYTFDSEDDNKFVLDLNHRDIVLESYINKVNDSTIEGYRISKAWADKQTVCFRMVFSHKFRDIDIKSNDSVYKSNELLSDKGIVASINFGKLKDKQILVKVGISAVDIDGAAKNLLAENPSWNFDSIKDANQYNWRKELGKIEIEDENVDRKTNFYTSLYHTMIVPNMFSDVDGRYRGMDQKIHTTKTNQYTVFSLWDTYRAAHPLYTIIDTKRTNEFIHTFKNQYDDGGIIPIWELAANYTECMIGYHSIPVITDAYLKNITDVQADTLLQMMLTSAMENQSGLIAYRNNGYISSGDDAESVSKTLEYAYDDWCIASLAKKAGNDSIYKVFIKRAQNYKNVFDPQTTFMRPKLNCTWKTPFDPSEVDFNYTEANSWQYSFYVPQDIYTLIKLMGGKDNFEKKLDELFSASSKTTGREQSDITGLIGQYAHGNEPSHHMAYLYNFVNRPDKTQKYVQKIVNELYKNSPDGLCGNEDCGQMSAWYVLSTLGIYAVNPANGEYVFGKPFFDKATINLENGKQFIIERKGSKNNNEVVGAIFLNGKNYTKSYIHYSDIMNGGTLIFEMTDNDNIDFKDAELPTSIIRDNIIVTSPSIVRGKRTFRDSTIIEIEKLENEQIFYSIDDGVEKEYTKPFVVYRSCQLKMWKPNSLVAIAQFHKVPDDMRISIVNKWPNQDFAWHKQYPAGGNDALIDGIKGMANFRTGDWQGYYWEDFEAVVDMGKPKKIHSVNMICLQDAKSWIWMPSYVNYWGSNDSVNFFPLGTAKNTIDKYSIKPQIEDFKVSVNGKTYRYIKVYAKNHNVCPKGHLGEGGKGFIFMDEIEIK
jgi:predicted alpha-1,2-mannosidase